MSGHRWSGWPGAWCLDCGREDPTEIALADGKWNFVGDNEYPEMIWAGSEEELEQLNKDMICPEPGSNRHNPYMRR